MEINERFRQVRNALDVSQDDFATKANRTRSEIKNIEYGKTAPKSEVVNAVCRAWNINEQWLRTGEGEMFVALSRDEEIAAFIGDVLRDPGEDSFRRRFVSMLSRLSEADWAVLERMALALSNKEKKD